MTEFTKGEWTITNGTMIFARCIGGCRLEEDAFLLAQIRGWGHLQYLGEDKAIEIQEANARLIAAAPDLYDACKRMLGAMRCDELNCGRVFDDDLRKEVKEKAEAALAKADKN